MSETQFSEYKFRVDEVHGTQKKEGRYEVSHWVRIPAAEVGRTTSLIPEFLVSKVGKRIPVARGC